MASDYSWIGHHTLLRTLRLEGVVLNKEPLRVGAGRGANIYEPVDLVVLKTYDPGRGDYVPVIPGSSWKGLFRAHVNRLLANHGVENLCQGLPRSTCLRGNEFERMEMLGYPPSKKLEAVLRGEVRLCLGCLIFGSPGFLSHAFFEDSMPLGNYRLGYRSMVAINRRTGASHRGALFSVEYVEPGAQFGFAATLKNLPNYAVGLIAETLLHLDQGLVKVGGLKSRGFGRVELLDFKVKVEPPVEGRTLPGLDPMDSDVELRGDWRETLRGFVEAWQGVAERIREISSRQWRWVE